MTSSSSSSNQGASAAIFNATTKKVYTTHPLQAAIINSGGQDQAPLLHWLNDRIERFSSRFLQSATGFKLTL